MAFVADLDLLRPLAVVTTTAGNLDIRHLQLCVTVFLPRSVPACGLAIGDPHFTQGDGEVSETAIEVDADFTVTARFITGGPPLTRTPHFEEPARVLDIPSRLFYATTGLPLKAVGEPPDMRYLDTATNRGAAQPVRRTSPSPRATRCLR